MLSMEETKPCLKVFRNSDGCYICLRHHHNIHGLDLLKVCSGFVYDNVL
jgi:hypothetical protein